MRQGTTPTHTFTLPIPADSVTASKITYAQGGNIVLEKGLSDLTKSGNTLSVTLTQEETLKFAADQYAQVQVRILTDEGKAFASNIDSFYVARSINQEVLE